MRDNITKEDQKLVKEWLKENEVTVCDPNAHTDPELLVFTWGSKKKKKAPAKNAK
jgi:hypothetical protein